MFIVWGPVLAITLLPSIFLITRWMRLQNNFLDMKYGEPQLTVVAYQLRVCIVIVVTFVAAACSMLLTLPEDVTTEDCNKQPDCYIREVTHIYTCRKIDWTETPYKDVACSLQDTFTDEYKYGETKWQ